MSKADDFIDYHNTWSLDGNFYPNKLNIEKYIAFEGKYQTFLAQADEIDKELQPFSRWAMINTLLDLIKTEGCESNYLNEVFEKLYLKKAEIDLLFAYALKI